MGALARWRSDWQFNWWGASLNAVAVCAECRDGLFSSNFSYISLSHQMSIKPPLDTVIFVYLLLSTSRKVHWRTFIFHTSHKKNIPSAACLHAARRRSVICLVQPVPWFAICIKVRSSIVYGRRPFCYHSHNIIPRKLHTNVTRSANKLDAPL